ncbi:MAG: LysE family translocator [Candidatus Dormibacteria bacterium]
MLLPDRLAAFTVVALVLVLIPGPSVLFIITRAVTLGRAAALTTVLGNTTGQYLQVLAVAFGVGVLVERSVIAFSAVKLLGALYLVVLGVRTFRRRHQLGGELTQARAAVRSRRVFRDGLVVGATNPKTAVFFAAVLPQFVVRSQAAVPFQILTLGLVWVVIALLVDSAWGLLSIHGAGLLGRSPRRTSAVGAVSGVITASLGVGLALTGNRR